MRLLVGPTCAGKSTLSAQWKAEAETKGLELAVHFGYQLGEDSKIPTGPQDVLHFNLLRGWTPKKLDQPASVAVDPLLPRLIEAADEIIVIVAPPAELVRRATDRTVIEPSHPDGSGYRPDLWVPVLESDRLPQIYEHLALALDQAGKPHRYLCSNSAAHADQREISRWDFPLLGGSAGEQLCAEDHPARELPIGVGSYQSDYRQGGEGTARSATMATALGMPLNGKRLLDIGCAEGAAALSASRMGARVTGIEPWPTRFKDARQIADSLGASVDLRNLYLGELNEPDGAFDVVLALNVIHHQPDPFAFLDEATRLTSSHLVIEYPSLNDRRFRSTVDFEGDLPDDVPLIAVSTVAQDQTFVFAPASLIRYLVDTTQSFASYETFPSPKPNRWITVFSERRTDVSAVRASEAARSRQGRAGITSSSPAAMRSAATARGRMVARKAAAHGKTLTRRIKAKVRSLRTP